jgi:hypothetical protein
MEESMRKRKIIYFAAQEGDSYILKEGTELAAGPFDSYHNPGCHDRPDDAYEWSHKTWNKVQSLIERGEEYRSYEVDEE